MCARCGTVLGRPDLPASQELKLQQHIADKCSSYGEPKPSVPGRGHIVMLPDPSVLGATIDPNKQTLCSSCAMCENFVKEDVVANEIGWTAGLCAARGKLLMSNRLTYEAKDCEYRQFGTPRSTTGGMTFLPEYEEAFGSTAVNPVAAYFNAKAGGIVEPGDWPTDKEVTEGERTAGIKAWRKVEDPDGNGSAVYFPVYDASFFDDEDRALIPKTGSDEHPELYVDHFGGLYGLGVAWLELDETPVFWGMPGVGKTELLRYAAWIMQVPFRRISITASTEIDDIAGKMMFSPEKGTYFQYGRLPDAWSKPGVLCIDEPNVAQDPAVWHFIRPLTDNSKQLVLDMNASEHLDRHPDCYMGMAMNPAWDTRNVGALQIADADANRLFHTYIEMPPEPLEREIIQERVKLDGWELSKEQMDMVMAIAKDLRALSDEEGLPITWAIRQQIKVARALRWFTPMVAYRRAAGDYLSPEQLEILKDQVRAHVPEAT
jgi:MoxR-like ATPase